MENQNVKSLKIFYYRIYATNDYFYDPNDSNTIKPLHPLIINDYPEKDWNFTCYFGEVPEKIMNLHYSIRGFGLFCVRMFGQENDTTKTGPEQMEECIRKIKSQSTFFKEFKWYTIEILERDIDILNCNLFENPPGMVRGKDEKISYKIKNFSSANVLQLLSQENKKMNFSEFFDRVSFCLTSEIPSVFFRKFVDSGYGLLVNETLVICQPKIEMTGELSVGKKFQDLNQEKISSILKQKGTTQNKWLNNIAHSYMAMLREKDRWKKFYFGFICLEILTHKIFKKIYHDYKLDVHLKNGEGYDKSVRIPISDIIPDDINRIKLAEKFAFVAGMLNPDNYSDDRLIFMKCKKARDEMSHGEKIPIEELPVNELQSLLDNYIQIMIKIF
jgi:translation initiation factor 2 beta subunit (eIF-2beta)/eIF-5